jgi:hypothetical protein
MVSTSLISSARKRRRLAQLPDLAGLAEHHGLEGANATVQGSAHRWQHYGAGAAESRAMADFPASIHGCNGW